jgi:hypothetical protein
MKTSKNVVFTICARNFIGAARALRRSYFQHNNGEFYIFVVDGLTDVNLDPRQEGLIDCNEIFKISDHIKYKYSITEYCTFLKPICFEHLFESYNSAIYLDPDILVFNNFDFLLNDLNTNYNVLLTPHICQINYADKDYSEVNHLFEGIYNFGFLAMSKSDDTVKLLAWWRNRLMRFCYGDRSLLLHTDQAWGNYFPAFLREKCKILNHLGCNVAHWNLSERQLARTDRGNYIVNNNYDLIFFHFSGFDYSGTSLTKRGGYEFSNLSAALQELATDYRDVLSSSGHDYFLELEYGFAKLGNDANFILGLFQRRMIGNEELFSNKTASEIQRFLQSHNFADYSLTSPAGYSSNTERDVSSKIKFVQRLLKLLFKILGVKNYSKLVRLFNYLGKEKNHTFLIGKPK